MVRDANQKAAAAEATNIFQNHYPEFLVRPHPHPSAYSHHMTLTVFQLGPEILHQRSDTPHMGLLALQTPHLRKDSLQIHTRWNREACYFEGVVALYPC